MQPIEPDVDWTITTRATINFNTDEQGLGILGVISPDSASQQILRMADFSRVAGGAQKVQGFVYPQDLPQGLSLNYSGSSVYLRATKRGNTLEAFYSPDGVNYTSLGSPQVVLDTVRFIGLYVVNPRNPAANAVGFFDFFELEGCGDDPCGDEEANLTDSLLLYYPLEGNAQDASGKNNHGILNGNPNFGPDRHGNPQGAITLDGTDDFVQSPLDGNLLPLSIAVWFNANQVGGEQSIVDSDRFGLSGHSIILGYNNGDNTLDVQYHDGAFDSGFAIEDGRWYHAVALYDTAKVQLYIDGAFIGEQDHGPGSLNGDLFRIGRHNANDPQWFNGRVDDVRIYQSLLTENQICRLANDLPSDPCQSILSGLQLDLPMNDTVLDVSGNDFHPILHGPTLTEDRFGNPNSAYNFDGFNSQYMELPTEGLLKPDAVTLSAWVRLHDFDTNREGNSVTNQYIFFTQNDSASFFEGYELGILDSTFTTTVANGTPATQRGVGYSQNITLGEWYHIASTAGANELKLYVNGVLEDSTAFDFNLNYNDANLPVFLGSSNVPTFNGYFNGVMDEVKIYNRVLSADEIFALYNGCEEEPDCSGFSLSTTSTPETDGGMDGTATVASSGGEEPIHYTWSTVPAQTTATATGLAAGSYTVNATDGNGCVAADTITVEARSTLTAQAIVVEQASCDDVCDGRALMQASGGARPLQYEWTDGSSDSLATGLCAGTYMVAVIDAIGTRVVDTVTVGFEGTRPLAGFEVDTMMLIVAFSDLSTGNPDSWSWTFGDGQSSMEQNPVHQYDTSGTFEVCLTVANNCGQDTACMEVVIDMINTVEEAIVQDIRLYPNPATDELALEFHNNGRAPISLFLYDITGRMARTVFQNQVFSGGFHREQLPINGLPSGLYYFLLQSEQFIWVERIALGGNR